MFRKMIVGAVAIAMAAALNVASAADEQDPLLATVGKSEIHLQDLRAYVQKNPLMRGYMTHLAGVKLVLDDMVNSRLLALEGQRKEIALNDDETPDSTSYLVKVRGLLTEKCEMPTEEGAKAYYDAHPEQFSTPPYARVSRLYLPADKPVNGLTAKDYLMRKAQAIHEGRDTFDGVLEKTRPYLAEGAKVGDMGFLPMNESNPLIDAVNKVGVGDLVGPFEAKNDVFLFQVTERRAPVLSSWEAVKGDAASVAYKECRKDAFARLRDDMAQRFGVSYNEKALAELRMF